MFPLLLLYPEISSNCQSILYNKCVVRYSNFIESVSATAIINSLISTSNFSLMIQFKTNLQVMIYIIYSNEPDNNFISYFKTSNGVSNNYLIVTSK